MTTQPALTRMPTAQAWDRAAAGWDRHTPAIRAWLADATRAMLDAAHVKAGGCVIDVAAGAGDQTLNLAGRVGLSGSIVATDLSRPLLDYAKQRLGNAGIQNIQFLEADAEHLSLEPGRYDAAVCRLGLMFCLQPQRALAAIHNALKPGTRFSALVFAGLAQNPCLALTGGTIARFAPQPTPHPEAPGGLCSLGAPGKLRTLFREAGFDDVCELEFDAPFHFPSVADYVEFVRTSGSPLMEALQSLPAATRERAWQAVAEALAVFNTSEGWVGPNRLLLVSGASAN